MLLLLLQSKESHISQYESLPRKSLFHNGCLVPTERCSAKTATAKLRTWAFLGLPPDAPLKFHINNYLSEALDVVVVSLTKVSASLPDQICDCASYANENKC